MRIPRAFLLFAFFCFIIGCKQTDNPIVAKAFHHKLYVSELIENVPYFESKEDSLIFMEQYIEDWVLRQTLLAYAKQKLTQKEQDFSSQIKQYTEQLFINAYMRKITQDSTLFAVPLPEINIPNDYVPEYRKMVKLNYIKLSINSKQYKKVKELFFDENDRMKAAKQLELLCADTIEYYLDNERWFYVDVMEKEFSFSFSDKENMDLKDKFDFIQDDYRFLVLILDRKQQLQPKNSLEDKKMAQALLQQQKKVAFVTHFQDSLVKKALLEKKVIKYPVIY